MRLLELEIQNVRGIRQLILKPEGKNLVICGPNGSGKSAVVDAIDFLLTGRISRLMGKGTGGITLGKHGPHIDQNAEAAVVRALLQLRGISKPVEMKRCMANPGNLECDKSARGLLEPILFLAERRQHVLTRREILTFVTAEAGDRAKQIQYILNMTDIEEVRQALVKVDNSLGRTREGAENSLNAAKATVNATLQINDYSEDVVLQLVNRSRSILGGKPISILRPGELKLSLKAPTVVSAEKSVNMTLLERDVQNIHDCSSLQKQKMFAQQDSELRGMLKTIRSDPELLRAVAVLNLTELGISLIDKTGRCPLCDKSWPVGELRSYLEQRLGKARTARQSLEKIKALSSDLYGSVAMTIASLDKVIAAAQQVDLKDRVSILGKWHDDLTTLLGALGSVLDKYPHARFDSDSIKTMLTNDTIFESMKKVSTALKEKFPQATPEQNAWDILTRLEENLKAVETAKGHLAKAELMDKRAKALHSAFLFTRDKILSTLYDSVGDRFAELYRKLHGPDESKFTAKLRPEDAGLDFEVDFYGRGNHPPHALHSEGHQDSMGLCLFMALAEHLTSGFIDLMILDDVVMSVDSDHRREICRLLRDSFPSRQFIITTHDKTWANQLRSENIVDSRGIIEFYNWHVDTGPCVDCEVDMWERIEQDLQHNDVPGAAARLRRGSEYFFSIACDALQALVIYKLNSKWELGDYLPAATG